jgi:hypothetical protein
MKLNVYSIYDSAAKAYTQPFFMHNDGLAIRAFQDNVNAPDNNIANHPDQFTLFCIGEYDDSSGELSKSTVRSLGTGLEYKNQAPEDKMQMHIEEIINKLDKLGA